MTQQIETQLLAGAYCGEQQGRPRDSSGASRVRRFSLRLLEFDPPPGMWHATGESLSKAPSLADIRQGDFDHSGWRDRGERERRKGSVSGGTLSKADLPRLQQNKAPNIDPGNILVETDECEHFPPFIDREGRSVPLEKINQSHENKPSTCQQSFTSITGRPSNGYLKTTPLGSVCITQASPEGEESTKAINEVPFKRHTWTQSTLIGMKAYWKFFLTPFGFVVTIYGLNVVAWGAMIFFLLINAAPAMCHPSCNDINSARRKWIEIVSQILNALFCVTGFGLIPWRFRDLFYLLRFRFLNNQRSLSKLAGIHRSWFRLPGHCSPNAKQFIDRPMHDIQELSTPISASKTPSSPLTSVRAPSTAVWKLDFVIWSYVLNTFFQAALAGCMWGLNRFNRPSWTTGFLVSGACIVAGMGGMMVFFEGRKIKRVEGVVAQSDTRRDIENGHNSTEVNSSVRSKVNFNSKFGHNGKRCRD